MKKRLIDLAFLAGAALVGLGVFYGYVMIRNHNALDQALIQVIQESQKTLQQAAPQEVPE